MSGSLDYFYRIPKGYQGYSWCVFKTALLPENTNKKQIAFDSPFLLDQFFVFMLSSQHNVNTRFHTDMHKTNNRTNSAEKINQHKAIFHLESSSWNNSTAPAPAEGHFKTCLINISVSPTTLKTHNASVTYIYKLFLQEKTLKHKSTNIDGKKEIICQAIGQADPKWQKWYTVI